MYTLHVIHKEGFPIKIYVNADNSQCYVFPPFGRYFSVQSDVGVLDFAVTFILSVNNTNVLSMASYKSSQEDTAIINIAA